MPGRCLLVKGHHETRGFQHFRRRTQASCASDDTMMWKVGCFSCGKRVKRSVGFHKMRGLSPIRPETRPNWRRRAVPRADGGFSPRYNGTIGLPSANRRGEYYDQVHLRLAIILAVSLACDRGQDEVRMGTEGGYPPYNFMNDAGEVDGLSLTFNSSSSTWKTNGRVGRESFSVDC